jgi:TetR/AcrR family transcriptional repressor of nem operon
MADSEHGAGVLPRQRLTRKGQATRDRIVATSSELMHRHGVAAVSTEDVQRAADVSPSQLYHYFGDRRSLIRAVIARQTQAVLDCQLPLLDRVRLDDFEALDAWRDAVVGMQREIGCEGGCPMGVLAGQLAESDPAARADLAAGFARWETAIREGLDAMRARGELRPDADTGRLALALLAAAQGGLLLAQVRRDTVALEAALDGAIDHIRAQRP